MRRRRAQDTGAKECGLHSGNMVAAAAEQAAGEQQRDLWVGGAVEALSREQVAGLLGGPRDCATLVAFYAPWCPFSQARARARRRAPPAAGRPPGGGARRILHAGRAVDVPATLDRCTHTDIAHDTCDACRVQYGASVSVPVNPPMMVSIASAGWRDRRRRPTRAHALAVQAMEASFEALAQRYAGSATLRVAKFQADVEREFSAAEFGLKTFPTLYMLPAGRPGFVRYPSERRDTDTLDMWAKAFVGYA